MLNNGSEFDGAKFQQMLIKHSIHPGGTTVKNPQSNDIYKRMYHLVADILRVIMRTMKKVSGKQANQVMDDALVTCQHALCCVVNHTIKTSIILVVI